MGVILRKVRKSRWTKEGFSWLRKKQIQADALDDLITENNTLSGWYVTDKNSNLKEVLVALATNRNHPANLDYVLIDVKLCSKLKVKIAPTKGNSPYKDVNEAWHRDLVELTATKVLNLARLAHKSGAKRVPQKQLLEWIAEAYSAGKLEGLKDSFLNKIKKAKTRGNTLPSY